MEGLRASPHFSAYNISKAGLIMLGKSQAAEWAAHNIRVNVLCPGLVKTKLSQALWSNDSIAEHLQARIPLGRMAHPDEIAGIAVYLASEAGSYVSGSTFVVDGGLVG